MAECRLAGLYRKKGDKEFEIIEKFKGLKDVNPVNIKINCKGLFINEKILEFHKNKPEETDLTYYIENFVNKVKTVELVEYSRYIPEAYSLILKLKTISQNNGLIQLHNIQLAATFEKDHALFNTEFKKLQPKIQRINNH